MGPDNRACKQCEAITVAVLADHSEVDPHFIGFCETEYLICEVCGNAVKMKEEGKECLICIKNGSNRNNNINKMVKPKVLEQRLLKQQKCLPRCAQICYNKCLECLDRAEYFERQLPRPILTESSVLKVA